MTPAGRNIGLWDNVYLTSSGPVTLENPHAVTTLPLPETSSADVSVEVELVNHDSRPVKGILRGTLGELKF